MKGLLAVAVLCTSVALGLSIRAAEQVDDEGFIRNWLVLGPIAGGDKAGNHDEENQRDFFDKEFFPGQFKATPSADEKVKIGDAELTWTAQKTEESALTLPEQDNTINIVVAYIVVENDMPNVSLAIGSDDSSAWRLNGEEIIRVYSGRGIDKDQDKSGPVTLKKGVNVLQGIIINGGGPTAACARFTMPVKNIAIQTSPK